MIITHFISSPASGGAEVYVKDLSIAKAKLGHSVHILFLSNASEIGRDKLYEENFLSELDAADVTYSFIGNSARRNPLMGIIKLREHIKDFSPDVLHCHLYYALVFSMFTKNVKVYYTHHSINHSLFFPKALYYIFSKKVSAYIGICNACTEMLEKITSKEVVKINNAVSSHRLIPKIYNLDTEKNNEEVSILMIGRITEQKNYSLILDVVDLLSDLKFSIYIAGEGPEFNLLQKQVVSRGLSNKIKFLGNISNIPEMINSSDIFAMTSKWEGLPISLIEASLSGLPTIVTNVGGCAEVSHECLNGFVLDDFSAENYASKLRLLIESSALRRALGMNSLKFSESYKITTSVSKHINLYQGIS